ncbi:MAG: hypothetical protein ACMXYD_04245 [Candidatus Woesearchaeota archaeon]
MNKALILCLVAALVVFAACESAPEAPDLATPYIGGVQGIAMSFPQGMPPAEIFDDGQGEFSIGILLENVGESAVGPGTRNPYGHVEIIGINPRNFGSGFGQASHNDLFVTFDEAQLTLEPARRGFDGSIITGESGLIEFPSLSYLPDITGNQQLTVRANVCYEYRSYTRGQICIKDNLLERAQDDSICTVSGAKAFSGSGAPVQVTSLTQNPAGSSRIQVTFTVENLGRGIVFAPMSTVNSPNICQASAGVNTQRDVVGVQVSLGDEFTTDYLVNCPLLGGQDRGVIRMFQGAPAVVTCTIDNIDASAGRIFTENLNVDLHYTYLEHIERPLLIRDTNVGFVERSAN